MTSARSWTAAVLEASGHVREVPDAELCVSELAANAVRHARTPFAIEVSDEGGAVRIAVRDGNFRFVSPAQVTAPTSVSGRGLQIVAAVASAWGVADRSDEGKTIWCTLPPPTDG